MEEKDGKVIEQPKASAQAIADLLWDEIHSLKVGETSAANLSAITNATGKIFTSYILQLKYAQMTNGNVDPAAIEFMGGKIQKKELKHKD